MSSLDVAVLRLAADLLFLARLEVDWGAGETEPRSVFDVLDDVPDTKFKSMERTQVCRLH